MMRYKTLLASVFSLQIATALAHGGEEHGEAQALPVSTQSRPSAEANSEDFELYAQLQGDILTVYLDRYRDNQPVVDASIEVESETFKATLQAVSAGTYRVAAAALNHPGEHNLLFTVLAGEQSDLLDAVLQVQPASDADQPVVSRPWWWLGIGLVVLVSATWLWLRHRRFGSINNGISQ
jgi:hypothetical protein